MRGETMLPDIGRPQPDIRITPRGDNRGKSGMAQAADNQPSLDIDQVALRAYIEAMADIFQEPHLSLFIVADSTGEFYSYGYRILDFHPIEQELSGGERELYIYVHPNETGDGLYRMNVGIIPRSRSAFEDYQRWLLPEYVGLERVDPMQLSLEKNKPGAAFIQEGEVRLECFWETCTGWGIWEMSDGWTAYQWVYPCKACYYVAATGLPTPPATDTGGGNSCWETDSCIPNPGGGGRDGLDRSGCNGDPGAFKDHCGRCVGGDTGRRAAPDGADCTKDDDCSGTLGGSAYLDTCDQCVGGSTQKVACCASMSNNITRVIEDEGGYVNHPDDRGGKTKYGITRRTWNTYASRIGVDPATRDVSTITENEAREIYERFYYSSSNAEAIARMDGDLAMIYFNFFVNTPGGAVEAMQNAIVHLRGTEVFPGRGRMGQMTLDEIQKLIDEGRLNDLHNRFKVEMQHHYNREVANNSSQSSFINGWTNRINKFPDKTNERTHNLHCK